MTRGATGGGGKSLGDSFFVHKTYGGFFFFPRGPSIFVPLTLHFIFFQWGKMMIKERLPLLLRTEGPRSRGVWWVPLLEISLFTWMNSLKNSVLAVSLIAVS